MRKTILCFLTYVLVSACLPTEQRELSDNEMPKSAEDQQPTEEAKKWLIGQIEAYFEGFDEVNGGFSKLCTKEYFEFKTDATNIDYDGGMSEDEFKKKWGKRYSKFAGIGEGFLVAGNDFGKIKVTSCEFKNKTEKGGYLFKVLLFDIEYKSTFIREITVMPQNATFLIDDVLEIENNFTDD
jgi:hypothetical protein